LIKNQWDLVGGAGERLKVLICEALGSGVDEIALTPFHGTTQTLKSTYLIQFDYKKKKSAQSAQSDDQNLRAKREETFYKSYKFEGKIFRRSQQEIKK